MKNFFSFKVNRHDDTTAMLRLENTFIVSNGKKKRFITVYILYMGKVSVFHVYSASYSI